MSRLRFYDLRVSTLPEDIGLCVGDVAGLAKRVNSAENRLIMAKEAGDEGWWGCWAEMAFTVNQAAPYLTTPRNVARIEAVQLCNRYIPLQNQFYEYMRFGNGRLPKLSPTCAGWPLASAYTRNTVPTFVDIANAPQNLIAMCLDPSDAQGSRRILWQGIDLNGNVVYSLNGQQQINGIFSTLAAPFAVAPMQFNAITGIQKDITNGPVQIFQMDPTTGAQVLLLTMEPSETSASYRRYYFDALPNGCCCGAAGTANPVTVTAMCKLEPIPIVSDTDYLNLQGTGAIEAILLECQAIRYSKIDNESAKAMDAGHHKQAIGILNGILNHYMGKDSPAVSFKPFGSAALRRKKVGMI